MGLIATALSQLLGFGLEQADGFIDRKIESGQLAEAASATRKLLEEGEANMNSILQTEGIDAVATSGGERFNALEQALKTTRDPNQQLQIIRDFKESGSFGLGQRALDTRDDVLKEANKETFDLVGSGISTQRGSEVASPLGLNAENILAQRKQIFQEEERFKTDENVRETGEESNIPGRVSRGGNGGTKTNRTKMNATAIKDTLLADPRFIEPQSKLEELEGKPAKLNKLGREVFVDVQTRKTFDSQVEALGDKGISISSNEETPTTAQEQVDKVNETTDKKVEEQVYKTKEQANGNLSAMAGVLQGSSDEKLEANIKRAENIFKKAGKADKKAKAEFQKIMAEARKRRKKRTGK